MTNLLHFWWLLHFILILAKCCMYLGAELGHFPITSYYDPTTPYYLLLSSYCHMLSLTIFLILSPTTSYYYYYIRLLFNLSKRNLFCTGKFLWSKFFEHKNVSTFFILETMHKDTQKNVLYKFTFFLQLHIFCTGVRLHACHF